MTDRRSEFLTPPEVARLLRVRREKVLYWVRRGELPASDLSERRGGRPRFRIARDDLDAFLERRQVPVKSKTTRRRRKRTRKDHFAHIS